MTVDTPIDRARTGQPINELTINTIRTLSIDAVQAANSGHPGTPMALAPVAYTLWQHHLRFDPDLPVWANRDRFVLSVGHASALLYSLLHLTGVKSVNPEYEIVGEPAVSLDDLRRFRQLDSKCPGHPEYRWTSGVECTTGPLGTGIATSVGMAIAGVWQAATFNRPGFDLFDYDSVIGYGAPHKQGTHAAHGEPLGADEVRATKRFYNWPEDEDFLVPDRVREHVAGAMRENGGRLRRGWEELFARYAAEHPDLAEQLNHM